MQGCFKLLFGLVQSLCPDRFLFLRRLKAACVFCLLFLAVR